MNRLQIMLASIAALGGGYKNLELTKQRFGARRRKKKGGGRGGFTPPRHAKARAWKRAFGGLCVPRIDNTQFFFE